MNPINTNFQATLDTSIVEYSVIFTDYPEPVKIKTTYTEMRDALRFMKVKNKPVLAIELFSVLEDKVSLWCISNDEAGQPATKLVFKEIM
jgi:hypothetical protein